MALPQLQAEADRWLRAGRPRRIFKLEVNQVAGILAGEDYDRGDKVDVEFEGEIAEAIVTGIRYKLKNKRERITVKLMVED